MGTYREELRELREPTAQLRDALPEAWEGFSHLHRAALADGVVDAGVKEAIALAISVVKRCNGCIAYHARGAARAGATPEVVSEILGVALLMDGGTASVYAPKAWAAFQEFHAPSHGAAG